MKQINLFEQKDSSKAPTDSGSNPNPIRLEVRGVDNITSFKNQKQIVQIPIKGSRKCQTCGKLPGRPMLVTKAERRAQMEAITRSLVRQLSYMYQTIDDATLTECYRRSLTALFKQSIPFDDRWQILPKVSARVETVAKGEEGADIELNLLT